MLLDEEVAGKDATDAFFGLHRHEVLLTPRYARLQIGTVQGQKEVIPAPVKGAISQVPYAEPSWLAKGYHSPYFTENHRKFQEWMRKFVDEHLYDDAQAREEDGKFPAKETVELQAKYNILAMRLGPGKHLKGLTLADGLVKPEEARLFSQMGTFVSLTPHKS